jgi:hypothetical protein
LQLAGLYPFDALEAAKVNEVFVSLEEAFSPLWGLLSITDHHARREKQAEIVEKVSLGTDATISTACTCLCWYMSYK